MNIGMCLHPVDPAIRNGDHGVSQTQTEHDIFRASTRLTHKGNTQTHISNFKAYKKGGEKMCLFFKLYSLSKIQANTILTHTRTFYNLAIGWVVRPILPPGSPRLSLFVGSADA